MLQRQTLYIHSDISSVILKSQGLLNFKHQVDKLMCCALFDIVLLQPLNDELFIYFLKNDALVQSDLCLLFNMLTFTHINGIKIKCGN